MISTDYITRTWLLLDDVTTITSYKHLEEEEEEEENFI